MGYDSSWHVPRVPTYDEPLPSEILHVLFLERIHENDRFQIITKLSACDEEWTQQFNPNLRPRRLNPVPWIRDYWPSSDTILRYAQASNSRDSDAMYQSFILIDSGWDADTCIASTWVTAENEGERTLSAARVPISIANPLLTLIDNGDIATLAEGLGNEVYEDSKVDFYKDRKPAEPLPEASPYEPPAFLRQDLTLSRSYLTVISLQNLDREDILSLTDQIMAGKEHGGKSEKIDIQVINWQGEPTPRKEISKLFHWLESNDTSNGEDQMGYAFFVDNIMQSSDGGLQIIAASRTGVFGRELPKHQIALLPIATEKVIAFWEAASVTSLSNEPRAIRGKAVDDEVEHYCADIWRREHIIDFDSHLESNDFGECVIFFFLQPFTLDQERTIRKNVTQLSEHEEGEDWGHSSAFVTYDHLWPSENQPKSLQDLRDLFEKSEPMSPFYAPGSTPLRLTTYPHHFFGVDERVLDPEEARVILVSSLDFYHPSNELGWLYGQIAAEDAHINYANLDIANMGPEEMVMDEQGPEYLWLSDLDAFAKEDYEDH